MKADSYDKARELLGLHDREHERLQKVRRIVDRIETVKRYFEHRAQVVPAHWNGIALRIDMAGATYCINLDDTDAQERAAFEQWLRAMSGDALARLSGQIGEVSRD